MRKRFKLKQRTCALCKPHKRGWEHRWTPRDLALAKLAERDMRSASATA
jgi:hypothetical protein